MKKKSFKSFVFILLFIWIVSDFILTSLDPIKYSSYFGKNDYEITRLAHPEKVWDKVFFGSSVVNASYIEEKSESGYINAGMDYGTISDIYKILKTKKIEIGSDLVLALNDISFLDTLPTNPTYIWHKKPYQHYIFFQRDRIYSIIEQGFENIFVGGDFLGEPLFKDATKHVYHGHLTDEELKADTERMLELFGDCKLSQCEKNFKDLEKLIEFCNENNIRLRAVWMPWNGKVEIYDFATEVMNKANAIFASGGVEVYDMTSMIESEYFYDIGHMSYDNGAEHFTKMIDEFLCR